jgi:hypothetical protein
MEQLNQPVQIAYEQGILRQSQTRQNARVQNTDHSQPPHAPGHQRYNAKYYQNKSNGQAEHYMKAHRTNVHKPDYQSKC